MSANTSLFLGLLHSMDKQFIVEVNAIIINIAYDCGMWIMFFVLCISIVVKKVQLTIL